MGCCGSGMAGSGEGTMALTAYRFGDHLGVKGGLVKWWGISARSIFAVPDLIWHHPRRGYGGSVGVLGTLLRATVLASRDAEIRHCVARQWDIEGVVRGGKDARCREIGVAVRLLIAS